MRVPAHRRPQRQRGAVVVEAAFVLPILLLFVVGIIFYGYLFVVTESLQHAAAEGAEAAVAVNAVGNTSYDADVVAAATDAARDSLRWLPDTIRAQVNYQVTPPAANGRLEVRVRLNLSTGAGVFPQIALPPFGTLPPLPGNVQGLARVTL